MRRSRLIPLLLVVLGTACATKAPALHRNPVVKVEYRGERPYSDEERKMLKVPPWVTELYKGSGSGFLANGAGDIVTNYHVVAKDGVELIQVVVTVDDKWLYPAKVVHSDKDADLAVVRIEADERTLLPWLPLGRAAAPGAALRVQGYPGGGPFTQSRGTVVRRGALLECTVPVRIGNSGGPALWEDGSVAGVVTGLRKRSFGGAGARVTAEFCLLIPVETLRVRLKAWDVAFH